jgi:hypothetical protein
VQYETWNGKPSPRELCEQGRVHDPEMPDSSDDHPLGIVGVVRVVGVVNDDDDTCMPPGQSRWYFGPFGWVLDNVTSIDPVPCKGMQGLWELPPEVLSTVRERYRLVQAGR